MQRGEAGRDKIRKSAAAPGRAHRIGATARRNRHCCLCGRFSFTGGPGQNPLRTACFQPRFRLRLKLGAKFALGLRSRIRRTSIGAPVGAAITVPDSLFAFAGRDLIHRTTGRDRERLFFQNVAPAPAARFVVPPLDQEPILVAVTIAAAHSHQVPAAAELFAFKHEIEVPLGIGLVRVAFGNPLPTIPDHDRAAAVLAPRNGALERIVFNRVILDVHGEPFFAGIEAGPACDRPAFHHAVEFEP